MRRRCVLWPRPAQDWDDLASGRRRCRAGGRGKGRKVLGRLQARPGEGSAFAVLVLAASRAALPAVSAAAPRARARGSHLGAAARCADDKPPPSHEMAAAAGPTSVR